MYIPTNAPWDGDENISSFLTMKNISQFLGLTFNKGIFSRSNIERDVRRQ